MAINRTTETYLKQILEVVEDLVLIFDKDGKEIFCNRKNHDFTLKAELIALVKSVVKNGQLFKTTLRKSWAVNLFPIFSDESISVVCVIVKNLEGFAANDQLVKAHQLNRELEGVIQSSYDGIGIIDGNGTLLAVNNSYLRITGLTKEESGVGRKVQDLEKEGHVSKAVGVMVLKEKRSVTIKQKIKTGKEILITGNPVFDDHGEIVQVVANIRDITELNLLKEELNELRSYRLASENIIANSQAMKKLLDTAVRVARVTATVLITGESGVGKEVVAKVIHKASEQRDGPFITINCGAIPEHLLESEMFGYEKGAFTGANREGKMGIFQAAHKGTLLLDEIGEMPLNLQVKLLRVLQEREVVPVGAIKPIKVDVRIIALTNKNLNKMAKNGTFREDLYYRLNVVPLSIPPLRERREDIIALAMTFMDKFNKKYSFNKRLHEEVLKIFEQYDWPGNVRELETTIERLLVTTEDNEIKAYHLPEIFHGGAVFKEGLPSDKLHINIESLLPLRDAVELLEKRLLIRAITQCRSSRQAARELGVDHSTVVRKAQKYQIKW